jgi:hypothetical protein
VDEVHPTGSPVPEQAKPVVELKPVDEVHPAGKLSVVVVVVVVVVVPTANIAFNFTRVDAPINPVPEVKPTGARTADAYLFWKAITAALVNPPKVIDSIPIEPTPEAATCVVGSVFNKACKHLTSVPEEPRVKFLVKFTPAHAAGAEEAVPVVVVVVPNCPCNEANWLWSWAIWAAKSEAVAVWAEAVPPMPATNTNAIALAINFLLFIFYCVFY